MATYEQSNFDQIASAIGVKVGQIAEHENLLEAAALWYRLAEDAQNELPHPSCARSWTRSPRTLVDSLRAWVSMILMKHPTVLATVRFSLP